MANVSMTVLREPVRGEAEVISRGVPVSRLDVFSIEDTGDNRLASSNDASFKLRNRRDIKNGWRLADLYGDQWEITGITRPTSPGGFMTLDARRVKAARIATGDNPYAGFDVLALNDDVLVNNDVAIGLAE